ncbi:kinase-like domain-containing protein [Rhizoctonia solani]|nr:kinase-like domain-containing protein [Rhizoctonia solani]
MAWPQRQNNDIPASRTEPTLTNRYGRVCMSPISTSRYSSISLFIPTLAIDMHDLKSTKGVVAYLKGTRFTASDVHLLAGGVSAFTYRVVLESPLENGENTIVIKHFEGYLAHHEEMKWGIERADHEYKALAAISNSGLFDSDSIVQLPRPIEYDEETHTIFMTDLGSPIPVTQVLKEGFPNNQTSLLAEPNKSSDSEELYKLSAEIGRALGDFLGRFHNWSALPQQTELRGYFTQNPGVVHKSLFFRHFCFNSSADRFKMREAWMDDVLAKEQQELEASTDPGVMIMGDCSLHNSPMRICLIDLETARAGHPEFDVGSLTATATSFALIHHPNIDHPFAPALHDSYRHHRELNPKRLGITTGTDLLGLGTFMPWARGKDEASLRGVATVGFELLNSSVTGDEHIIKGNRVVQHLSFSQS